MKAIKQGLIVVAAALLLPFGSCVDDLKFGDSFLEKAPGGTVTQDTVFNSAEYTRQFLTGIYGYQYFGLQEANSNTKPHNSYWRGKFEALSDLWLISWDGFSLNNSYYAGALNSGYGTRQEKFHYLESNVWQAVRWCYLLIENIDRVPNMSAEEKAQMVAEAKCIIAARYFDIFRHYGGVPIVKASFLGTEESYEFPRATVEEMVTFITGLLDEAAAVLPWQVNNPANDLGHWTKAGAMGLKTSVLLFAASPLFNDDAPYASGAAADARNIWWGGYKPELWQQTLTACEQFFAALAANGAFELEQAHGTRPEDYRLAFRTAYFRPWSTEVLHSVRINTSDNHSGTPYAWWSIQNNNGRGYNPSQEYVEMFPWADGTPFDWNQTVADGKLDEMFMERVPDPRDGVMLTRDPRLYETVIVNGLPKTMDWNTGNMSGAVYETFLNGNDAKLAPNTQFARYGTGYTLQKYFLGMDSNREDTHWCYLRLAEVILNYAEALCQTGAAQAAIDQVDLLRKRVGMQGLQVSNPALNLLGDKQVLLDEILRERACELGMEDSRFFDMIRYKMKDRFEMPLHRLFITRQDGKTTSWLTDLTTNDNAPWPEFNYERLPITNPSRLWWRSGFDSKWYLSPFPLGELVKGYGLVQNPGW
jgi:hypothetical protein